ncbi:hypothetical protein [Rhizobium sp. C4]|uniref:hypothetical protein n=1 Tax=Rhizobium sp. C4 TaxID=1349800 RepID=UPI001E4ED767|nr:hypothetical protein [Rhizobium sp. C4]MCD2174656.1 hypothetical protein [Rhizobium sp. C4]
MTETMATVAKGRKGTIVAFAVSAVLIILFACGPILSALLASTIADIQGCALDEGGVHPCMIGGADYGETLSVMFVLGWFGLVTLPLGALAAVVWCVALTVVVVMNIRRKKS